MVDGQKCEMEQRAHFPLGKITLVWGCEAWRARCCHIWMPHPFSGCCGRCCRMRLGETLTLSKGCHGGDHTEVWLLQPEHFVLVTEPSPAPRRVTCSRTGQGVSCSSCWDAPSQDGEGQSYVIFPQTTGQPGTITTSPGCCRGTPRGSCVYSLIPDFSCLSTGRRLAFHLSSASAPGGELASGIISSISFLLLKPLTLCQGFSPEWKWS